MALEERKAGRQTARTFAAKPANTPVEKRPSALPKSFDHDVEGGVDAGLDGAPGNALVVLDDLEGEPNARPALQRKSDRSRETRSRGIGTEADQRRLVKVS